MVLPRTRRKQARTVSRAKKTIMKDSALLRGIKQGVGMVTRSPFGQRTGPRKVKKAGNGKKKNLHRASCLNALTSSHLALPRATGSYTVVKTSTNIYTGAGDILTLIGTFKGPADSDSDTLWMSDVAVSNVQGKENEAISATGGSYFWPNAALKDSGYNNSQLVPSAITVQIMNPNALQDTMGICYIGRCKQTLYLSNDSRTWAELAEELMSYSTPRLCSAGKLALRGVQVSAIPYNMSELSDFCPRAIASGGVQTWAKADYPTNFAGFAPIFIYNPQSVRLQLLVTVEWRVRFDPANPAYAGHTYHMPASDETWAATIAHMEGQGHGCGDIAAKIAETGIESAF